MTLQQVEQKLKEARERRDFNKKHEIWPQWRAALDDINELEIIKLRLEDLI